MVNYQNPIFSSNKFDINDLFSIYKETGDFQVKLAFQEFKEVSFLFYYLVFQFILYNIYNIYIQNFKLYL